MAARGFLSSCASLASGIFLELFGILSPLVLQPLVLGLIADHFHEAAEPLIVIAQGFHVAAGEEAAAILPEMPAIVRGPAFREADVAFASGAVLLAVFRGENNVDGLAEDLAGAVTEDLLGPRVPARDIPLEVERENRMLANVFDDQPELLFSGLGLGPGGLLADQGFALFVELSFGPYLREDPPDRGDQEIEIVRSLREEVADSRSDRLGQHEFIAEAGHEDGRDRQAGILQLAIEVQPAFVAGEAIIEDHQVDSAGLDEPPRLGAGLGLDHGESGPFEASSLEFGDARIVLQHQDGAAVLFHGAPPAQPRPFLGTLTTWRKRPSWRIASTKASYSMGLVM